MSATTATATTKPSVVAADRINGVKLNVLRNIVESVQRDPANALTN